MKTNSLYVHIPFCDHLCSYCDFCKVFYQEDKVEIYLQKLQEELINLKIDHCLSTIYIGGGTPSSLSLLQLETLLTMLQPYVDSTIKEFCIEVNPESMTKEKMKILKEYGITRLSIGVQSFQDKIVKAIDRHHCFKDVLNVFDWAKECDIENLSIDLMYGLPTQTKADIDQDLAIVATLPICHISYYSLILEDHTVLKNKAYQPITMEEEECLNTYIDTRLETLGFKKYEVSNYAKEGYQSIHNLVYWQYDNYYGIGVGASSKIDHQMLEHTRNIDAYIQGKETVTIETMSLEDQVFTNIMMSLRLLEGIDIEKIKQRYQVDLLEKYQKVIEKYQRLKMLEIVDNKLRCTKDSILLLNSILLDFM